MKTSKMENSFVATKIVDIEKAKLFIHINDLATGVFYTLVDLFNTPLRKNLMSSAPKKQN